MADIACVFALLKDKFETPSKNRPFATEHDLFLLSN